MLRGGGFGYRGLRWGAVGLSAVVAVAAFADAASARRSHRPKASAGESYQPSYASIVVDANSGAVMQATNADSPRHPASLTKIMTLYLLFERLEQGKVKLTTDLPASAHAAVQAPSKLGLKPGESIRVETAIRAIVTKSANDVAVIVAEALGGDEASFARMMTAKAQALGMSQTVYRNASGLPDEQQITTARDQAILGRAIQDRFPTYYQYFATRTFEYRGKSIRNHNHLLGAVDGLDGIKTGYIHDSGFNIVTSVRRANHHVVAVVFGGRTAEARDARVRSLIDNNINIAAVKRTAPPVVEGRETAVARRDSKDGKEDDRTGSAPVRVASAAQAPAPSATDAPAPGSTDPIKPVAVRTVAVHPGTVYSASLTPLPSDNRQLMPAPAVTNAANITTIATVRSEPQPAGPAVAASPPPASSPAAPPASTAVAAAPAPVPVPPPAAKVIAPAVPTAKVASAGNSVPVPTASAAPVVKPRGAWLIQVGALPDESDAKQRLEAAQNKAKNLLGKADPFTERTEKGDKVLFRARFAGLEKDQAEAACKHLKRSAIPCMLLKN
ncbi:MAG TPA: D-alanyl-D-alanine carboxypeptidase [Pseudolabrys sp.]|jgi:D-alanyl-D-alanine carboxypeptidase|nr:D-alanyl-D-alanine carboxypeptidase [Pseudolabrys sp.]